jgi:starch synthase
MAELSIVFATSEIVPYSKTGGLADVSGALPHQLVQLGHKVTVFTPLYREVDRQSFQLARVDELASDSVILGGETYDYSVHCGEQREEQATVYLLDCPALFAREGLYIDPQTGKDYPDNDVRFAVFCLSALRTLERLELTPDIIHANDWQTALLPVLLKLGGSDRFSDTRTILTIHNLGYQGLFPLERRRLLGLDESLFAPSAPFEFWGRINYLKAGIHFADLLNTVSKTYAAEIQTTDDFGYGLEGVLRQHSAKLHGVVNGVDYQAWSPESDPHLVKNYSIESLADKKTNKLALLRICGFGPELLTRPLIGMISRLADQKGFDIIESVADQLFAHDFTFVLLGTGDTRYHQLFTALERTYPDKIKAILTFDNKLAHQIEAGSDMFLMPSRYEPCGLNQLYSLRYGTVPIGRKTGGLADTIVDYEEDRRNSTGFLFEDYTGSALVHTVERALKVYRNQNSWQALMKRGMRQDFSWQRAAQKYVRLYELALAPAVTDSK